MRRWRNRWSTWRALVGAASLVMAIGLAPGARAGEPDKQLEELQGKIDKAMERWAEHRSQTITVKEIAGLEVSAGAQSAEQLQLRLKSLLTKKRSNREWLDYWREEQAIADELAGLYEQVAPLEGEGLLDAELVSLKAARDAAAKRVDELAKRVQTIEDDAEAATKALQGTLERSKEALPELDKAVEEAKKGLNEATQPIDRLKTRVEAAGDAEAKAKLQQELTAAQVAVEAAKERLKDARTEAEARKLLVSFLEALLAGETPAVEAPTEPAIPAETAARIKTLLEVGKKLEEAKGALKQARDEHAKLEEEVAHTRGLATALRARRKALTEWSALAKAKQENQDRYFEAINADIAAIEERIRGMSDVREGENIGRSAKVCESERRQDQSPWEKFGECKRVTREEIKDLRSQVEEAGAAQQLNEKQAATIKKLIDIQQIDLDLVQRELKISEREYERAKASSGETKRWRETWQVYSTRARGKVVLLDQELRNTKDTARTLKVNDAFFASEQEAVEARIERLEARLDERTSFGRTMGALLQTAWFYIRTGYMVPVWLLLAWLLLRLSRRVEKKVVEKATAEADDKDEVQRVQTLATVTRGAIKLVVFIATFLLCLEAINIDTGPILGGAAIFGLAISFGSQSLVKDFVTGFFILLENQYAVGDVIQVDSNSGTVEQITMRRTVLRDLQGRVHNIPNGAISNVINMTQGWSRVVMHIGVAYGTDLEKVKNIIDRLGDEMFAEAEWKDRLDEPPRYVGMTQFGDSSLNCRVMFQTKIFEQWAAEREFNLRVKNEFEKEGVEIPFPQRDLHIVTQVPPQRLEDQGAPEPGKEPGSPAEDAPTDVAEGSHDDDGEDAER